MSILIPWGVAATLDGVKLIETGGVNFKINPTLAAGDVKLSKDGGAEANLGTLPTVSPAGGTSVRVVLSAAETECARAVITFVDAAGAEWENQSILIHTPLQEGGLAGKITSGTPTTTAFRSSQLAGLQTDHYKDVWIKFLTGACAGALCRITAFDPTTDQATVTALPTAPAVGDVWEALL
jgi:hypothetical protein